MEYQDFNSEEQLEFVNLGDERQPYSHYPYPRPRPRPYYPYYPPYYYPRPRPYYPYYPPYYYPYPYYPWYGYGGGY
ncbi:hypothetical protein ACO1DP_13365 [Staphylococcus aureus]|uniref:spore coat protein n=1 Tax=Staphylococcus aureus TaxID=1280 RepID=UPI000BF752B5|nr:spore coat protein [Priestia megaterium]PFI68606.1 spore coat protein [Priestia megaterium]PFK80739.1 spore coat protein [Priestia megaterium]PGQ88797.1 spore coat protein [Priestia megaterium]QDZ88344.1 spore coat protein [Priestia megaterium]